MSHRSSIGRPSSAASRHSVGERRGSYGERESFLIECKAAYLAVFDDLSAYITTKQDLYKVLQQAGRNAISRTLNKYWNARTDHLTFDDFCDICRKEPATSEDELLQAFRKIDVNGDGFITNSELRKILTTRGEKMTKEEVQDLIDEVDENGDGRLNYKEFIRMVLKTQEECKKLAVKNLEKKQNRIDRAQALPRSSIEINASAPEKDDSSDSDEIVTGSSEVKTKGIETKMEAPPPAAVPQPRQRRRLSQLSTATSNFSGSRTSLRSLTLVKDTQNSPPEPSSEDKAESKELEKQELLQSESISSLSEAKPNYNNDDDDDDDDEIVVGISKSSLSSKPSGSKSASPPIPTPRSTRSTYDLADDSASTSSKGRDRHEWSRPGLTSKQLTIQKPRNLKDWKVAKSKGCFFLDEKSNIIGHQFDLKVVLDTKAWITIEPISIKSGDLNSACEKSGSPMDVMLVMLDSESRLVACTEQRDQKGKSIMGCDLERGVYRLIAFTTGCHFRKRNLTTRLSKDIELLRKKDGKVSFTKEYRNILNDIFDMFDLNGDGFLSRDEFSLYNLRTSGQEVADPEWEAVEATIDLKDGLITRDGFLHLNQMEAEENQDNIEELWMTLDSLGFNRNLVLDEASPFIVEVHTEKGNKSMRVAKLDVANQHFANMLAQISIDKGESFKVKGARDVFLCAQVTDGCVRLVIDNRSMTKTSVVVDCRQSMNIISHQKSLNCTVDVPAKSAVIAHHLLPVKDSHPWTVVCQEYLK